jgi:ketosteroid isomerase-like protein
MSQENADVVRRAYEAWNGGDMVAFRELLAPDVIARTPEGWPEPGPFVGREAFLRWCEQLRETWDADALEPISDFIEAGERVTVRQIWHGAGYGPEANLEMTWVGTVRKGKIVFVEFFWDHAEALEAVGPSEWAMSQENVEIVRAALQRLGPNTDRDDWIHEFLDAEIEWHDTPTYPSAGVYIGHEAFSRHAAEYEDAWADWGIEIEDIRAAGDRVVARIRYRGVGKQSGAPITGGLETPSTGAVFELRGGRIVRVVQFVTHAEALEAVGPSEQAMSQENVEVVRRSWEVMSEATNHGDDAIARLFEQGIFAQECSFIPPQGIPGGNPFVGQEEISDWYRTWTEEFVDYRWSAEKIIDAGDHRVVAVVRQSAKGRESGAAVELRAGFASSDRGAHHAPKQCRPEPTRGLRHREGFATRLASR